MNVQRFDQVIERLLEYLETAKWGSLPGSKGITPAFFDDAEPLLESGLSDLYSEEVLRNYGIFIDAKPSDIKRPFNIAIIGKNTSDPEGFSIQRFKEIHPREVRSLGLKIVPPFLCDRGAVTISRDGKAQANREIVGLVAPRKWIRVYPQANGYVGSLETKHGLIRQYIDRVSDETSLTTQAQLAMGLSFTRHYFWAVRLGLSEKPKIRIPTDASGVAELFRLRDIPNGAARRSALRHWIGDHWRKLRNDPAQETYVRKHLSGAFRFNWNGLHGEIVPSDEALERNELFREERERMRLSGTDRRASVEA